MTDPTSKKFPIEDYPGRSTCSKTVVLGEVRLVSDLHSQIPGTRTFVADSLTQFNFATDVQENARVKR